MNMTRILAVILVFVLIVSLMPLQEASASFISDSRDLGEKGETFNTDTLILDGYWKVYTGSSYWQIITGNKPAVGESAAIVSKKLSGQRNFADMKHLRDWVDAFNGNYEFVADNLNKDKLTRDKDGKTFKRPTLRQIVDFSGGFIPSYNADKGEVYAVITTAPTGSIYLKDSYIEAGEETSIKITASSYVCAGNLKGVEYEFEIDEKTVARDSSSDNVIEDEISYTFDTAGKYEAKLIIKDGVDRTAVVKKTINVADLQTPPEPPPPPENDSGPTADFDMPSGGEAGQEVEITNRSGASGDNWIVHSKWEITPSSYDDSDLIEMGGTVVFEEEGYYEVTLTVWDNENNSDSITKNIYIGEPAPPPPPPVPPNSPPTARFSIPSSAKQGDTVDVVNRSYDDGDIVDVDWDISSGSGVDDNLGFDGGTITFTREGTYTVTLEVTDDQGATDETSKTIEVTNQPPVAKIKVPSEVMQGDDVTIKSRSYDPDGEIAAYYWEITPSDTAVGTVEGKESTVYFNKEGDYTIRLTVEDEWGLIDTAEANIHVKPAIPTAFFAWNGDPKQNRKMVFDAADSYSPDRYPIVWEQTQWEIIPPDGVSEDAIKIKSSDDLSLRELLLKKPGNYTIRLAVTNTAGHTSEWYEKTIEIRPDDPPVADFYVVKTITRNPDNGNAATIYLQDQSYSIDGDDITKRVWKYRYDSDNDGDFNDETWIILDDGNNLNPKLETTEVGKYQFELYVEESFGQETIPEFIQVSPPFSQWTLSGGATVDSDGVLNLPQYGAYAMSPYIPVDGAGKWYFSADYYMMQQSPNVSFQPDGGRLLSVSYYDINKNPVKNDAGYFSNGSARAIPLNTWTRNEWSNGSGGTGGSSVAYVRFTISSNSSWTPSSYSIRNPMLSLNGEWQAYTADNRYADTSYNPLADKVVEVINLQPLVNFNPITKKKVDIIFTIGEVNDSKIKDLQSKITQQIETKLVAANVEYGTIQSIESSTFSSNDEDAEKIFNNWERYGVNPDTWEYYKPEKVIRRLNNDYWAGFYDLNFNSSNYTLEVDMGTYDDDNDDIGITFGMDGGPEGCYAFLLAGANRSFRYSSQSTNKHGHASGLYQYNGSTITGLVNTHNYIFRRNNWYHVKLEVNGKNAKIWLDGDLIVDFTAPRELKGSYGFFTNSQPKGAFKNLTVSYKAVKTLDEILKEPSWREDALRFLVNISDVGYPEFNNPEKSAVIYSQLLSNNIHFMVLGADTNREQAEEIIQNNNSNGTFIYNNNMDSALSQVADYIINQANLQQGHEVEYVLLNQEVEYNTFYMDTENDPEYERRWKYIHDPYYFENSMGEVSFNGQYIPESIRSFLKVGKYEVFFQAKDNPKDDGRFDNYRLWSHMPLDKKIIYVHRKPVVQYTYQLIPDGEIIVNTYEQHNIDFSGEGGRTAQWKPQFDTPYGSTIKTIEFMTPRARDDYWRDYLYVEGYKNGSWYKIKDYKSQYEYTSEQISDTINVEGEGYTKVRFYFNMYDRKKSARGYPDGAYIKITYTSDNITSYDVDFTNYSYDLDHESEPQKGIVEEEWKWKESTETVWHIGIPTTLDLDKAYLVSLRVKDKEGVWSDADVKVINTSLDNKAPIAQFRVIPDPLPLGGELGYEDYSYDPNGDSITNHQWRVMHPNGSWIDYGSSFPANIYNELGEYRIELKVSDSSLWSDAFYQTVEVIPENQQPVASFDFTHNPAPKDVELGYIDNSYDPDGDPIVLWEWQYKKTPSTTWLNGQPTDLSSLDTGDYEVRLRVKDQPALAQMTPKWSDWFSRILHIIQGNQKPVAGFTVTPNPAVADESVTYNDTSYDPDGAGISERVWQVKDEHGNVLAEYHNTTPPSILETTGWGDDGTGTYIIALRIKDVSPNGLSPALWSDWYERTLVVEDPLYVEGNTDRDTYAAGEAMILTAHTKGKAFNVEAEMWWPRGNDFVVSNVTELVPEHPVGEMPPDENTWETRHDVLGGDYDRVVIIPVDMPDGTYQVKFTAYKRRHDGTIKTVEDIITVKVRGCQLNKLKTRIIS